MMAPSTSNKASTATTSARASSSSSSASVATTSNPTSSSSSATASNKSRQYAHVHSQLAQLNAHLADTENLVRMTAVQAQDIRFLGGYVGAMFMGSAKVLGEESLGSDRGQAKEVGQGDESCVSER